VLTQKIKFKNGSWVIVIQSESGKVCEVHSNGLLYFHKEIRNQPAIVKDIITTLTPARGEVIINEKTEFDD